MWNTALATVPVSFTGIDRDPAMPRFVLLLAALGARRGLILVPDGQTRATRAERGRGAAARLAAHAPAGCQAADFPAVSDFQKLLLTPDPNHLHLSAVPSRKRGVAQRHETWGGMRWTRMVL